MRAAQNNLIRSGVLALLCAGVAAGAAAQSTDLVRSLPGSAMLGVERLRLRGGERLGLVGASYVLELSPGWWAGPSLYGAASGQRGGLFAWGVEGQRRWRLDDSVGLAAGLFAGGGGGANARVGGGLMLRPHVDLMVNYGGWQLGLTASHVRFPSGDIRSSQLGLLLMVDDRYAFAPPGHAGERVAFGERGGIGADRLHPTVGVYARHSADGRSRLGYVGVRLEQQATREFFGTLEAAGAASGGADGYMEVLAGLGAAWPVGTPALQLGGRVAAGLAGGGAVRTGGGALLKGMLSARWQLTPRWSLQAEAGEAWAPTGSFSSRFAQLSLGMSLGEHTAAPDGWQGTRTLQDMEWEASVLHYTGAARKDGSKRSMQLVGLQFNRFLSPNVYLAGQAQAAAGGGAGAYAVGLVGLGATQRLGQSPWRVGAEALVGAAGGGGVAVQGGAIAQPVAWVSRDLGTHSRVKLGAGYVKSRRGELSSPLAQLTWSLQFGTP